MSDNTKIEWTDATWNTITGCRRVDEGCRNCYAEVMTARFSKPGQWGEGLAQIVGAPGNRDHRWTGQLRFNEAALTQPLRWKRPRMIFVNSTSDMFQDGVPDEWIDRQFAVMALCPQHTFQVLTKRPERARDYLRANPGIRIRRAMQQVKPQTVIEMDWPLPNVWLGTSVSDQASADLRIPPLLDCPAAVRFISAEPLLGPVDLESAWHGESALNGECWGDCAWCDEGHPPMHNCQHGRQSAAQLEKGRDGIDWVICGGESGPGARPMHPDWARSLRDQCVAAGVPFFFKQWGEWAPTDIMGIDGTEQLRVLRSVGKGEDRLVHTFSDHTQMGRIGKRAADRTLDGVTWDQMPGVAL